MCGDESEWRVAGRFRGRGELIDHLLVSHALVHRVSQADTGPVELPSITEDPAVRYAHGGWRASP